MFLRMQNRVPLPVLRKVRLQLLPELRVLEAWCEAVHKSSSPGCGHRQPWQDFSVQNLMICLGFDSLVGEMREARRQRVSKCGWHGIPESGVGPRNTGEVFTRPPREELSGFPGGRLARCSVRAHLTDGRRA